MKRFSQCCEAKCFECGTEVQPFMVTSKIEAGHRLAECRCGGWIMALDDGWVETDGEGNVVRPTPYEYSPHDNNTDTTKRQVVESGRGTALAPSHRPPQASKLAAAIASLAGG